jgi:hypothetical protein
MNAGGRVPCRCGATVVLHPPRERRAAPEGARPEGADIATLGYALTVERATGVFDAIRQELRGALGIEGLAPGTPDPMKAARPALLWPALGLALEPGRFVPAAVVLLAALSSRWLVVGQGALAALAGPALAALAVAVAAAVATLGAAAATHEMIAEGGRLTLRESGRALARRPGLLAGAAREAGLRVVVATLLAAFVSLLAGLGRFAGVARAVALATAPAQALMVVGALAIAASVAHRLLAYAAVAPNAVGRLQVQAALEVKRITSEREVVPSRSLAPALAAALALAIALGSAARLALGTWDAIADGFGAAHPAARAVGRDVLWALAGAIWCSFVGVAGLLAGYALGTGAAQGPVRAPEIITGTWGAGLRAPSREGPEAAEDAARDERENDGPR